MEKEDAGRTARRPKRGEVLFGAPVCFPNSPPVHGAGRGELNHGHGRTDGKMAGVTNGTAMIGVAVFVCGGNRLQTHKAGEQQRY